MLVKVKLRLKCPAGSKTVSRAWHAMSLIKLMDLKPSDLPFFVGSHRPATGPYDQPKQQQWADKIALADDFIFISPEYIQGYSLVLKNALDYVEGKNGKQSLLHLSVMVRRMVLAQSVKSVQSLPASTCLIRMPY